MQARRPLGCHGPLSWLAHAMLRFSGWRVDILDPLPERCVLILYPHTSNWDFVVGVAAKWAAGVDARRDGLCFASKEILFRGPWAWFFRALGGFPVDRRGGQGFVTQMVDKFASQPRLRFALSPEGTRSARDHVRSSFYFVALAAKVPILLGGFDFAGKRLIVTETFTPTGQVEVDLAAIDQAYQAMGVNGRKPALANPWRFRADQTSSSSPSS